MNLVEQGDLRNKVDDVVQRLTQDAHKGEFNKRLNNHALYFQDAATVDGGTPHFMCVAGSILRDKECGTYYVSKYYELSPKIWYLLVQSDKTNLPNRFL